MPLALAATRVFTGDRMLHDHAVVIDGGRIVSVLPTSRIGAGIPERRCDGLLAPGFVDVQVNGGGGVLFNDEPSVGAIRRIGEAHRRFGTTGFLPTVITDRRGVMAAAIEAADAAIAQGVPGALGIHLEGPFLGTARKGVHDAALIRPPDEEDVARILARRGGRTLVTLAPETVPDEVIARLVQGGAIVSLGHTAADCGRVREALRSGASGFTHLYNAMPPLSGRSPGPVGAALDDPRSWCGVIADLHHVDAVALRVAVAAKPPGKVMLVTDAMPTVGTAMTGFTLQGREVLRDAGRLATADGTLAGSDLDMATAVRNCVDRLDLPLAEALRMASLYPAAFLGLDREVGRVASGYRADLVLLDDRIGVLGTWIAGVPDAGTAAAA